jgi:integrase/recombinase XerD
MAVAPVVLPTSGHAAWDDPATWWVSRYKASTQQTYATYLPRWTSWCAGRGLNPLRAGSRRRAVAAHGRRLRAVSGLDRRALRRAGEHPAGFDENPIASNPCARIARPKVLRELKRREVVTVPEYAAFLTAARALGPTHHAIAVLGGMLGLPASEMAGLTVASVSTVRGYVTLTFVGNGRQARPRPVPLPALPAVHAAIDGRTSGPLLRTRTGAGMERRSVHRYVARTARAAGIARPISPHALRRPVGTVGLD